MERFERTRLLLGEAAMDTLKNSHVLIAGLGAVGSYAVEGLARAGLGALTVVDFDDVKESNINRQLYALDSTVGMKKTELAAGRIRDINPDCRVLVCDSFLDDSTLPIILGCKPDVVIDAIDSLNSKAATIFHARQLGIPVISSMGAATRTDPGAIRVGDLSETFSCSLAKFLRKRLRKRGIEHGVRCVFSTESMSKSSSEMEAPPLGDLENFHRGRPRHVLGSFSCLTGIFGLIVAREAIFTLIDNSHQTKGKSS